MDAVNVQVFVAIAKTGSLSEAARALFFSQPTVSNHLNALEKELGVQLINRRKGAHSVSLTPTGERFLPLANRVLELENEIKQFTQSEQKNVLRIGATASAHDYLLADVVQRLRQKCPQLDIRLMFIPSLQTIEKVENLFADVGFTHEEETAPPRTTSVPIFSEGFCVLCPADTPLPDRLLSPLELDPNYEVAHISTSKDKAIAAWHRRHFPSGIEPKYRPRTIMTVDAYLTDPRSWVILPVAVAQHIASTRQSKPQIRYVDTLDCIRTVRMICSDSFPDKEVIEHLKECCREFLGNRTYLKSLL